MMARPTIPTIESCKNFLPIRHCSLRLCCRHRRRKKHCCSQQSSRHADENNATVRFMALWVYSRSTSALVSLRNNYVRFDDWVRATDGKQKTARCR